MKEIFARRARLPNGWAKNVSVRIDAGAIAAVTPESGPEAGAVRVDALLPGLSNVHSHSFQRAMAGMTERRATSRDSFWTWRSLMYRCANAITPDEIEAIAAFAFMEMQEAGFSGVGEFHYLHHQPGGAPYAALDEMCQRIFVAGAKTGIGLTLLPVLYSHGDAGEKPLAPEQARFGSDIAQFNRLVAEARSKCVIAGFDAKVGAAPHSLRAIAPADLAQVVEAHADGPIHMHVAEQRQEVLDVEAWLGARPVRWLLDSAPLDARWCLVHATHMTDAETRDLARSGAAAGLCPITEANLGDGTFNGRVFLEAGGAFGIGSDSNVRISAAEELRMLEYSQRLRDLSRNVLAAEGGSVGETLYLGAAQGGAMALGRKAGAIEAGLLADLVAVDGASPALCALDESQLLDGFCFAAGGDVVTDVWSAGRHCVRQGRHEAREGIVAAYRKAVAKLLLAL